jgi:hypothetical protein
MLTFHMVRRTRRRTTLTQILQAGAVLGFLSLHAALSYQKIKIEIKIQARGGLKRPPHDEIC